MNDLLLKIKKTEDEAKQIVIKAEKEAKINIEKTKSLYVKKINEYKNNIIVILKKQKEELINNANKEKENIIKLKIEEFNAGISGIKIKKEEAMEYLKKIIQRKING